MQREGRRNFFLILEMTRDSCGMFELGVSRAGQRSDYYHELRQVISVAS